MDSRPCRLIVAALAVWSLTAAAASAQTTLRYKFKQGEKLHYALDQKMKMTMDVMGNNMNITMDQTSDIVWTTKSVDESGSAKIVFTYGRQKMTMDTPMGKVEVDSDNAQAPDDAIGQVLYKVLKALASLEVTGTVSPLGEYSDIQIPEKSLKELQDVPGGDAFKDMLSADGLKKMMSQSGLVMPKDAVTKGSEWKSKSDMKLPFGKMMVAIGYKHDGTTEKDGRTLEKIIVAPKASIEPDPNSPIALKLKSHKGTGSALFDNAAGRLLEKTDQQTMEMEVEVMGITINQQMVQTVIMRLVEKK